MPEPQPPTPSPSRDGKGREDFNAFYDREIAVGIQSIEHERSKLARRGLVLIAVAVIGPAIAFFVRIEQPLISLLFIFVWPVVALIAAWLAIHGAKQLVKRFLVEKLCRYFDLQYSASGTAFPLTWFEQLHTIPGYDRHHLEDHLSGAHDGVSIQVCEAHLEEEYEVKDSKTGETETRHRTVFHGLLCYFSFRKRFNGLTIVSGDRGGIGNWFDKFVMPGEPVHLEDPRFEDQFAVYSTDQVEARYLLTPGFMERILELSEDVGPHLMRLAFDADHVLISLNHGRDFFEGGSAFGNAADPKRIARIYNEFRLIFDIIDTLGLTLKTRA